MQAANDDHTILFRISAFITSWAVLFVLSIALWSVGGLLARNIYGPNALQGISLVEHFSVMFLTSGLLALANWRLWLGNFVQRQARVQIEIEIPCHASSS